MARIVDATVAVALFVHGARTPNAEAIFGSNATLLAPDLLVAETENALWSYLRAARSGGDEAAPTGVDRAAEFVERLCDRVALVPSRALARDALAIAAELDLPAYDALYVALARRESAKLFTFDRRLLKRIAGTAYEALGSLPDSRPRP